MLLSALRNGDLALERREFDAAQIVEFLGRSPTSQSTLTSQKSGRKNFRELSRGNRGRLVRSRTVTDERGLGCVLGAIGLR